MKRKLAFLMASVMACGTMMMSNVTTAQAASAASLSGDTLVLSEDTMLFEANAPGAAGKAGEVTNNDYFNQMTYTVDLNVPVNGTIYVGDTFDLTLDNAEWFFRSTENVTVPELTATQAEHLNSVVTTSIATEGASQTINSTTAIEGYGTAPNGLTTNYDVTKGVYIPTSANSKTGTYVRYAKDSYYDVAYELNVTSKNKAKVTISKYQGADDSGAGVLADGDALTSMDNIIIPMVIRTTETNAVTVKIAGGTNIGRGTIKVAKFTEGDGNTKTYVEEAITSNRKFNNIDVTIEENIAGGLKAGIIALVAPDNFTFAGTTGVTVSGDGNITIPFVPSKEEYVTEFDGTTWKVKKDKDGNEVLRVTLNAKKDKMFIDLTDILHETVSAGEIFISGIVLEADSDAKTGEVYLNIKNASSYDSVTEEKFKVGTLSDYGVTMTLKNKTVNTLLSGKYDTTNADGDVHASSEVIFAEATAGSWEGYAEFVVSEGAKIRAFEITSKSNVTPSTLKNTYDYDSPKDYITVEDDRVIISVDTEGKNGDPAQLGMIFYLSLEPGFTGDVELTAIKSKSNILAGPLVIAKAQPVVEVKADVTKVASAGDVQTSDITIIETEAGALEEDGIVKLYFDNDNFKFNSIKSSDIEISEDGVTIDDLKVKDGYISFKISSESTKASKIVIKNVEVDVDNLKNTNKVYNLLVGGTAVAASAQDTNKAKVEDKFDTEAIEVPYLQFGESIVVVTVGSNEIKVGEETVKLDVAAFNDNGTVMAPVRGIAEAFGFEASFLDDYADAQGNTQDIVTLEKGGDSVQFVIGRSVMYVGNTLKPIMDVANNPVNAMIKDDRTFIPIRALGKALNVGVTWNEKDNTVTFDPSKAYSAN